MMSPRRCPKALPMVGMNPGRPMVYWLRYDRLTLRTIMSTRATLCAVRYQPFSSSGSLGVTVILNFSVESVGLYT